MSSVTHFLLRLTLFHTSPMSSRRAPQVRSGSPTPGCSTLITSAPYSPEVGGDQRARGERRGVDDPQSASAAARRRSWLDHTAGSATMSKNAAPESGIRFCLKMFTAYDTRINEYSRCSSRVASSGRSLMFEPVEVGDGLARRAERSRRRTPRARRRAGPAARRTAPRGWPAPSPSTYGSSSEKPSGSVAAPS